MYLSEVTIEGYRIFKEKTTINFNRGLNLLVGENGCGKSTIIDAIRILLNEDEYSRNGINDEDFYSSKDYKEQAEKISIKGKFEDLSEDKKIEYLTWLNKNYDAILNLDIINKRDKRDHFKKNIWGGESSNSIFEWEPLNDIQCVYLPALRDAERKLRASRGSRLARLLLNLSKEELKVKRKDGNLMDLEEDVKTFNEQLASKSQIAKADELINRNIKNALGNIFGQNTKIQFNDFSYEKIVEGLRLVFFPDISQSEDIAYRNLIENSLGYNNLIYLATILAEFEGLKENYTSPRILLIEELEAHLHPQLQIKLLKYLEEQANESDIQVIITTHSTTIAAATPIKDIISINILRDNSIKITSLNKCGLDADSEKFINRWLDVTKSTLLFSKGVILVEGIAEAMLIPKMAEIYLDSLIKKVSKEKIIPKTLEEAGISVINMNGIYFNYFMQLYNGYKPIIPERKEGESKKDYKERKNKIIKKEIYNEEEIESTDYIPIRCVALTDNDPEKDDKPQQGEGLEGKNYNLYLIKQLENMTNNCRVFKNEKTFEYDIALEKDNIKSMIEIILDKLDTDGNIRETMNGYLEKIEQDQQDIKTNEIAGNILKEIDKSYIGKGLFAQLLLEKIEESKTCAIPPYIKNAIDFVLDLKGDDND